MLLWLKVKGRSLEHGPVSSSSFSHPLLTPGQLVLEGVPWKPMLTNSEFEIQRQFIQVVKNKTSIGITKSCTLFTLYRVNEPVNE